MVAGVLLTSFRVHAVTLNLVTESLCIFIFKEILSFTEFAELLIDGSFISLTKLFAKLVLSALLGNFFSGQSLLRDQFLFGEAVLDQVILPFWLVVVLNDWSLLNNGLLDWDFFPDVLNCLHFPLDVNMVCLGDRFDLEFLHHNLVLDLIIVEINTFVNYGDINVFVMRDLVNIEFLVVNNILLVVVLNFLLLNVDSFFNGHVLKLNFFLYLLYVNHLVCGCILSALKLAVLWLNRHWLGHNSFLAFNSLIDNWNLFVFDLWARNNCELSSAVIIENILLSNFLRNFESLVLPSNIDGALLFLDDWAKLVILVEVLLINFFSDLVALQLFVDLWNNYFLVTRLVNRHNTLSDLLNWYLNLSVRLSRANTVNMLVYDNINSSENLMWHASLNISIDANVVSSL